MNSGADDWEGFWIGQQPTLTLRVVYLNPTGRPEEGWHQFLAEATAGGFNARFTFESLLDAFEEFGVQVRSMYDTLKGAAHFKSTESNVAIDASIDRFGHVFWAVLLRSGDADAPELKFAIEQDQTLLFNVASKIDEMLFALKTGSR